MIPAEAVEAASKAMFDVRDDPYDLDEWGDLDAIAREPYACQARAALEAAAPYLMAQAWDEGREADDFEVSIGMDINPYRKAAHGDD